jgi:outer membrane protein OmpA-like peptidoglycan-associated protein
MNYSNYFQFRLFNYILFIMITGLLVGCSPFAKYPHQDLGNVPVLDTQPIALGVQTDRGLQFTLNTVLFNVDKASLLPEGKSKIREFANVIQQNHNGMVLIAGHADSTGDEIYNDNLSERRAYSVQEALIAEGIDSERLIVSSFGERQPIASNATALGRKKNRRVEITLLDKNVNE